MYWAFQQLTIHWGSLGTHPRTVEARMSDISTVTDKWEVNRRYSHTKLGWENFKRQKKLHRGFG